MRRGGKYDGHQFVNLKKRLAFSLPHLLTPKGSTIPDDTTYCDSHLSPEIGTDIAGVMAMYLHSTLSHREGLS